MTVEILERASDDVDLLSYSELNVDEYFYNIDKQLCLKIVNIPFGNKEEKYNCYNFHTESIDFTGEDEQIFPVDISIQVLTDISGLD